VRNGSRSKTVLTESSGHVEIDVPRDRAGTFEPQIVRKRPYTAADPRLAADIAIGPQHTGIGEEFANLRRWVWPAAGGRPLLLVPPHGSRAGAPGMVPLRVLNPRRDEDRRSVVQRLRRQTRASVSGRRASKRPCRTGDALT
jgi:Transposase, Mutator family